MYIPHPKHLASNVVVRVPDLMINFDHKTKMGLNARTGQGYYDLGD